MRRIIIATLLFVFISSALHAQFDAPVMPKGGALAIPSDPNIRSSNRLFTPKSDPRNLNYKSSKTIDEPTSSERREPEQTVNPNFMKMSEGKDNKFYKTFQRNQDLGDVSTSSNSVRISCRDHEYVDGDIINIYVNEKLVVPNLILKGEFSWFDIKLIAGFNTIDFEAVNEGTSPPNTAQLKIHDENGELLCSREWNVATGYKASLLVVKK